MVLPCHFLTCWRLRDPSFAGEIILFVEMPSIYSDFISREKYLEFCSVAKVISFEGVSVVLERAGETIVYLDTKMSDIDISSLLA